MDIVKELEALEDQFYGAWEEDKSQLVPGLLEMHMRAGEEEDLFNRFLVQTAERFGGTYIPYLFWDKLAYFFDQPDQRIYLQELIRVFSNGNFEEEEQKKMKLLLVVYFATEKEFEIAKVRAQVVDKTHPTVRDYFLRLMEFVEKNQKATEMYVEKFKLLREVHPDFDLLSLPITQVKEKLQGVG